MTYRRRLRAIGAVASMALAGLAGGCGATHAGTASVPRAPGNRSVADSRTVPTTTLSSPTTSAPSIDPGRLSQTAAEPDFGAGLDAQMQTLWAALVTGSTSLGRRVFFPEAAYVRMKTRVLPNPAGDYTWRLIAFLNLDIAAYHDALGRAAAAPKLVAVETNPSLAAWIPPGACENTIGYWHLPGTRLAYVSGGRAYSFGVASLISWRGVWYVVHLGPNPRPANVGTVDDPQAGRGVPGPGGGC